MTLGGEQPRTATTTTMKGKITKRIENKGIYPVIYLKFFTTVSL